jgi:hypothetical protein
VLISTLTVALMLCGQSSLERGKVVDYGIIFTNLGKANLEDGSRTVIPRTLLVVTDAETTRAASTTGRGQKAFLVRRIYTTPPSDGIYDYDLFVVTPDRGGKAVLGTSTSQDPWDVPALRSIKGVRIFGSGPVVEITITFRISRGDGAGDISVIVPFIDATAPPSAKFMASLVGQTEKEAKEGAYIRGYTLTPNGGQMMDAKGNPDPSIIRVEVQGGRVKRAEANVTK